MSVSSLPWRCAALLAFALAAMPSPARADVYSFIDDDGTPRFSNVPDDPRYRLFLKAPQGDQPKATAEACDVRKPGDCKLRARSGREDQRVALQNPLLRTRPYHDQVRAAAERFVLDPALIHAVIEAESRYNPDAVSEKGAIGLMQVMPSTGRRYGAREQELRIPERNIAIGARYLTDLLRLFRGDVELALAGYNAGENAVVRYGDEIPPYAETKAYVPRVLGLWKALQEPDAASAPKTSRLDARPRR